MKLLPGDVFQLSAVENRISLGQIIKVKQRALYMVIYKSLYEGDRKIGLEDAINDEPILLVRTFDVLFNAGRWKVIGNSDIPSKALVFPSYKIETTQGTMLTDFEGRILRQLSSEEENIYHFLNEYSPAAVENGIRAYHEVILMDDYYRKMTYKFVVKHPGI